MIDAKQWKMFQQAYEIGNQVVDMLKNHKADAALLGLLAAISVLRRRTTFTIDDVLERVRAIDAVVMLMGTMSPKPPKAG